VTSTQGRTKVGRLLEAYDLNELGEELEAAWTADENRKSLRELADYFNRQLLRRHLEQTDIQPVQREIETFYQLLGSEDGTSADRTRVRRRLEREGIDVESLQSDFVSYQAIRTYLKSERDAEYDQTTTASPEREAEQLQQLQGRVASVADGKLEQLRDSGDITLGEFQVLVSTQVVCEECNTHMDVMELLEQGSCECS
jgi:hypothetical protein